MQRATPLTTYQQVQTRLIAAALYPAVAGLCRTVRWTVEGVEHFDAVVESGRQPIVAFWHGRILAAAWHFRRGGIVAMTSANFDGQWTARLLELMGNRTVAGSSSRGGARAMLELKRAMSEGAPGAFALDGPRGPARVAQPGAAWLAGVSGQPLLPVHSEASSHWTLRSWDRTQIPKPYSRAAIVIGSPIAVADAEAATLAAAGSALERSLAALEARAREIVRR